MRAGARAWMGVLGVAALGCASWDVPTVPAPPVGVSRVPYEGRPRAQVDGGVQAPPRARWGPEGVPVAGTRELPSGLRRERLREVLAVIDLDLITAAAPGGSVQRQRLRSTVEALNELVAPYPDMQAEAVELAEWAAQLPVAEERARRRAVRRMGELTDLIRLQLWAGF